MSFPRRMLHTAEWLHYIGRQKEASLTLNRIIRYTVKEEQTNG
jgi:hypothetical protein